MKNLQQQHFSIADCLFMRTNFGPEHPPVIELSVLSLHNLQSTILSCNPICRVIWCGEEVGVTSKASYSDWTDPNPALASSARWVDQCFYLRAPRHLAAEV